MRWVRVSECVAGVCVFFVGRNSLWKLATEASIAPYNLHMKTITELPSLINLQAALGKLSVQLFDSPSLVALFSATAWYISANCKQVILNMVSCHYVCIFFILLLHFGAFFFCFSRFSCDVFAFLPCVLEHFTFFLVCAFCISLSKTTLQLQMFKMWKTSRNAFADIIEVICVFFLNRRDRERKRWSKRKKNHQLQNIEATHTQMTAFKTYT